MKDRRLDPVFSMMTPLLFAHRGGAREQPESTERAFRYALDVVKAEVLELDVHVTKGDEKFVVWHGPDLNNVLIKGLPTDIRLRDRKKNDITELSWAELENKSWVERRDLVKEDVSKIQQDRDNRILLLEEMLQLFPNTALNIEMKDASFRSNHIPEFVRILNQHRNQRIILIVSQSQSLLERFRQDSNDEYPTGLSMGEVLLCVLRGYLPLIESKNLKNRALQSSHAEYLTPKNLINEVHGAGGAVHAFLTNFWYLAPAIDSLPGTPDQQQIFELLDRGVDGIMTDRPGAVRPFINDWVKLRYG